MVLGSSVLKFCVFVLFIAINLLCVVGEKVTKTISLKLSIILQYITDSITI